VELKKIGGLLYKASRDGFDPSQFHKGCDEKGATLVLIKSTEGCLFGGYSDVEWKSVGLSSASDKAFIFTLKNIQGIPPTKFGIKPTWSYVKPDNSMKAIWDHPAYGPCFGSEDIEISSHSSSKFSTYYNTSGKKDFFIGWKREIHPRRN